MREFASCLRALIFIDHIWSILSIYWHSNRVPFYIMLNKMEEVKLVINKKMVKDNYQTYIVEKKQLENGKWSFKFCFKDTKTGELIYQPILADSCFQNNGICLLKSKEFFSNE